jgi:integrase/recombinase XerD
MSVPEISKFLDFLTYERGFSKNTRQAYRKDIEQFFIYCKKLLVEISANDISEYVRELSSGNFASTTTARKIAALKSFFKFLYREGLIEKNPTREIDLPKLAKFLPHPLSTKEITNIFDALPLDTPSDWRDLAILELLYSSGVRVSELISIKLDDIRLEDGFVKVFGNGSKERIVPLGAKASEAIKEYLTKYRDALKTPATEYLFVSLHGKPLTRQLIWQLIKKMISRTAIQKNVSPHTLRHTFATHLIEQGADVRTVQEILGHANIATTQIYTAVSRSHLKKVYNNAHPRA